MNHLANSLYPMAVIAGYLGWLWLVGLLFTAACLPRDRAAMAVVLAPVTAMALLAVVHYQALYVLLWRYSPWTVNLGLLAVSATLFLAVSRFRGAGPADAVRELAGAVRTAAPDFAVPLLALVAFCSLFHRSGLELLSAGQDEFGYISTTDQIMNALHTGGANDLPFPRYDHYVSDFVGRTMAYMNGQRFGVVFLLADLATLFGLRLETAFPALAGVFIVAAVLALPAAVRHLFGLPRAVSLAAQTVLAFSGVLIILHFQGSLSHLGSLGLRMTGLAVVIWALALSTSLGSLALATVYVLGWQVIYYESAGFALLLPLAAVGAVALWRLATERGYRPWFFPRLAVVLAASAAVIPDVFRNMLSMHVAKLSLDIGDGAGWSWSVGRLTALLDHADAALRNIALPMLGVITYYDQSAVNVTLVGALAPLSPVLIVLPLVALAAAGLTRLPREMMAGYGTALLSLGGLMVLSTVHDDAVVSLRSLQMLWPPLVLGMFCLVSPPWLGPRLRLAWLPLAPSSRAAIWWSACPSRRRLPALGRGAGLAVSGVALMALVAANMATVWRATAYINAHTLGSDPTVHRLDPDGETWRRLRALLGTPAGTPVLLSGFIDTPTPHWLAVAIQPVPHLLGTSVTAFWGGMSPDRYRPLPFASYVSRWSPDEIEARFMASPIPRWAETYPRLLAATRKAVVPPGGGYPAEWGAWESPLGPRATRFTNVCDVIERDRPGLAAVAPPPLEAGRDEAGPYWRIGAALTVRPLIDGREEDVLEVRFTGPPPRIEAAGLPAPEEGPAGRGRALRLRGVFGPDSRITVRAGAGTRLRAISLYRLAMAGGRSGP